MTHRPSPRKQRGFTLAELVIVVVIIGILGAVGSSQYRAFADKASATAMYSIAQRIATAHSELAQYFRVTKLAGSSPVPRYANTMLDVLINGRNFVADSYQAKYDTSGFGPLSNAVVITSAPVAGSNSGSYQVEGYTITLSTPDTRTAQISFSDVPSHIVELIWNDHRIGNASAGTAFNSGVAVTSGVVQYTAASSGTHTLTLEFAI